MSIFWVRSGQVSLDEECYTISIRIIHPYESKWELGLLNKGTNDFIHNELNKNGTTLTLPIFSETIESNKQFLDTLCQRLNDCQINYTDEQLKREFKTVKIKVLDKTP